MAALAKDVRREGAAAENELPTSRTETGMVMEKERSCEMGEAGKGGEFRSLWMLGRKR